MFLCLNVAFLPQVAARLNAQGVDLFRSAKDSSYRGPRNDELSFTSSAGMHGSGSLESEQLPADLAGFEAAPDGAVALALNAVEKATAMIRSLQPAWAAMGGTGEPLGHAFFVGIAGPGFSQLQATHQFGGLAGGFP